MTTETPEEEDKEEEDKEEEEEVVEEIESCVCCWMKDSEMWMQWING